MGSGEYWRRVSVCAWLEGGKPLYITIYMYMCVREESCLVDELVEGVLPVGAGLPEVHLPRLERQLPI